MFSTAPLKGRHGAHPAGRLCAWADLSFGCDVEQIIVWYRSRLASSSRPRKDVMCPAASLALPQHPISMPRPFCHGTVLAVEKGSWLWWCAAWRGQRILMKPALSLFNTTLRLVASLGSGRSHEHRAWCRQARRCNRPEDSTSQRHKGGTSVSSQHRMMAPA